MLLEWEEVHPGKPDKNSETPFSFVARCGHAEVVKLLLGREDFNSNRQGNCGRAPPKSLFDGDIRRW